MTYEANPTGKEGSLTAHEGSLERDQEKGQRNSGAEAACEYRRE